MDILTFIYVFGCLVVMVPFSYECFLLFQQEHYSVKKTINSLYFRYLRNKAVYALYSAIFWALLVAFNLPTYLYLGTVVCFLWYIYLIPKAIVPLKITPHYPLNDYTFFVNSFGAFAFTWVFIFLGFFFMHNSATFFDVFCKYNQLSNRTIDSGILP